MNSPPKVFDGALMARRRLRRSAAEPNLLARTIAEELVERLSLVKRGFVNPLVIAAEPGHIAARLAAEGLPRPAVLAIPDSDELNLANESHDAIFSILHLHSANDVPGLLAQMRRALKPDGLLLACLFAGETLTELRQSWLAAEMLVTGGVSPRVAPMAEVRALGGLLQRAGFALPVADIDRTIVRYGDAVALIHEIRQLGLSNALVDRSRTPVTKRLLAAAANVYQENFADPDGRIRATIDVAWLTAWTPHESQQKPLKPGSAKMRLADALGIGGKSVKADRSDGE